MGKEYLPLADQDLRAWLANFVTYAAANTAGLGIVAGDVTPISTAQTDFDAKLDAHITALAAARASTQAKGLSTRTVKTAIRALVKKLQASTTVTDAQRQALGITVADDGRTPVAAPTTRPVVSVSSNQRLRHDVRFADEATPTRRGKPAGVRGAEVWVKIVPAGTAPPIAQSEMTFLDVATSSPFNAEFAGENAGKTAWYWLRWVNTRGEKGPWSEPGSATIAG